MHSVAFFIILVEMKNKLTGGREMEARNELTKVAMRHKRETYDRLLDAIEQRYERVSRELPEKKREHRIIREILIEVSMIGDDSNGNKLM